MKLRTLIFLGGLFGGMNVIKGQAFYGTTGLLHAPTAVMQKDKTVMLGGNMLDVNILSRYWVRSEYHPYTYNYYINCTLFPWLEVAYTCTLVKGIYMVLLIGLSKLGAGLPIRTDRFISG